MASSFSLRKVGAPNTLEYRVYVEQDGVPISIFHDIPLNADERHTVLNMVVEIPRWTNSKLEVRSDLRRPVYSYMEVSKRISAVCVAPKGSERRRARLIQITFR